jgi:hypothetical protein
LGTSCFESAERPGAARLIGVDVDRLVVLGELAVVSGLQVDD